MKKRHTVISMLAAGLVLSVSASGCNSYESYQEPFKTTYTFYTESPAVNPNAGFITATYYIGRFYNVGDLFNPAEDDTGIFPEGIQYSGWTYYNNPSSDSGESTSVPSNIQTVSSKDVMNLTASPEPASFYPTSVTRVQYTIMFDPNGGEETSPMSSIFTEYGLTVTLPLNTFTRYGYSFAGWGMEKSMNGHYQYADGESVSNLTTHQGETVVLYAQWVKNSYDIFYYSNNGESGFDSDFFEFGDQATIKDCAFTYPGKKFVGWNTVSDGSGTNYTPGQKISISDSLSLFAIWEDTLYRVSYNNGGGTGNMEPQEFAYGETVTIKENTFTRTGFVFKCWSDGTEEYSGGQTLTGLDHDLPLTAVWDPLAKETETELEITVEYTETGITFTAPAGYTSYTWFLDNYPKTEHSNEFTVNYGGNTILGIGALEVGNHALILLVKDSSGQYHALSKEFYY